MYRTLTAFVSLALLVGLAACGDFSKRMVCTANASPGCTPDFGNFEVPDLNGPNPNYPDPNAFQKPSMVDNGAGEGNLWVADAIVINEILLSDADGATTQFIELASNSPHPINLVGMTLRYGETTIDLSGRTLEAGEYLVLNFDGSDGTTAPLPHDAGSLALITPEGQILDFVQWGAAGQALEAEAALEGQWTAGEFCFLPDAGATLSHFAAYGISNTPGVYWAQVQSAGAENPPRAGFENFDKR